MSTIEVAFRYTVNDINQSVRRTNTLLRGVNALRLTARDIKQLLDAPNIPRFFWTMIQLTRTWNALRRLYIITMREMNKGIATAALLPQIAFREPQQLPRELSQLPNFNDLTVRTEVFLDNRPVTLDKLDLTDLPTNTRIMLQAIMEEDAETTVRDAQQILNERIIWPDLSTGFLEASIGWMPEVFGVRMFANAFYSAWVEEGHDNFTGHHYMRDAFARTRLRLPAKIQSELNGLILGET